MARFLDRFPEIAGLLFPHHPSRRAPFFIICGVNVLESLSSTLHVADRIATAAARCDVPVVFKASFDKANRTLHDACRGPGLEKGLRILEAVRIASGLPILTDVHETWQVPMVSDVVQVLQIPAMLCRQTDLIQACAATGLVVNIKKGQFASPRVMLGAVEKARAMSSSPHANARVMICERGTSFGYDTLIVDFGAIGELRKAGVPVILDATHAAQFPPAGVRKSSSGNIERVLAIARAGAAVGVDGLFLETHVDPPNAPVDGPVQLPLHMLERFLRELVRIASASHGLLDDR